MNTAQESLPRTSRPGVLVSWHTSKRDWLEGRGEKLDLISMIDTSTRKLTARFVSHDSTEENLRILKSYLLRHGRPVAFLGRSGLFETPHKTSRDGKSFSRAQTEPLPPTQVGRALLELDIAWIEAQSFGHRSQNGIGNEEYRLAAGLRANGVKSLAEANR